MSKLTVVSNPSLELKLHASIMNILFKHKKDIANSLRDIKSIYGIDHVAIIVINPNYEVSIFSLSPSVEYNLVVNQLWKFDNCFDPAFLKDKSMSWWEEAYHRTYFAELRYIKECAHKFNLGMNLVRKIDGFTLVYSFATRSERIDLKEYYLNLKEELFQVGDYGYRLIRDFLVQYCAPYVAPVLMSGENIKKPPQKSYLKLIINNIKKL